MWIYVEQWRNGCAVHVAKLNDTLEATESSFRDAGIRFTTKLTDETPGFERQALITIWGKGK